MKWLRSILRELLGLFIDDGSFAAAIVAWIAVVAFVLPRLPIAPTRQALLFAAGLLAILVESVLRRSRQR